MSKQHVFLRAPLRVAILAATLAVSSGAALAGGDYGAIAFSPSTHGHGYVFGLATREAAGQAAVGECEKYSHSGDCVSVVITEKGCGTLAVGSDAYGTGTGADLNTANASALSNCQSAGSGKDCSVIRWLCH